MTAPLRWNAPPPEAVKVNIDASFDTLSSNAGCGILVRNARGCVISCFCLSPLMAESLALLTALCLAISSGPGHQLLESDSLLLVSLHNAADEICHWELRAVVQRNLGFSSSLIYIQFVHRSVLTG